VAASFQLVHAILSDDSQAGSLFPHFRLEDALEPIHNTSHQRLVPGTY
jgi:hypothetical protein